MRISWKTVPNCRELNWTRIDGVLITWICLHFDFPAELLSDLHFHLFLFFLFSVCCYLWHRCTATAISSLHSSEKWRLPMSAGWALKSFPSPSKVKLLPHTYLHIMPLCVCLFVCLTLWRKLMSRLTLRSHVIDDGKWPSRRERMTTVNFRFIRFFFSVETDGISFISISFYIP